MQVLGGSQNGDQFPSVGNPRMQGSASRNNAPGLSLFGTKNKTNATQNISITFDNKSTEDETIFDEESKIYKITLKIIKGESEASLLTMGTKETDLLPYIKIRRALSSNCYFTHKTLERTLNPDWNEQIRIKNITLKETLII